MVERNPSPPREFQDEAEKFRQDMIGSTAISKKWIFETLLSLCKEVEKHELSQEDVLDISDELQDEACRLWDLSIEQDVALFLVEAKAIELISAIIYKSKSPRLTEILVGVLGNMSCTPEVCSELTKNDDILPLILSLLGSRDSPTLVEFGRLLNTCLSNEDCRVTWLNAIEKELPERLEDIVFILSSSTNTAVLEGLLAVMDACLDARETMLNTCLRVDFVNAVAEAGLQFLKDEDSHEKVVDCLHILQTISTADRDVTSILNFKSKAFKLSLLCCKTWCDMEHFLVGTDPSEVALASCLSLVNFVLLNARNEDCNLLDEDVPPADRKHLFDVAFMVQKQCAPTTNSKLELSNKETIHEKHSDKHNDVNDGEKKEQTKSQSGSEGNENQVSKSDEVRKGHTNVTQSGHDNSICAIPLLEVSSEILSTLKRLKWTSS